MIQAYTCKSYDEISEIAAGLIAAELYWKPNAVLGLATGSSPVGLYERLIEKYRMGSLDFSHATSVNLDEYRGLDSEHPQSYRYFMQEKLFKHINIAPEKTHVPDGSERDADKACRDYDRLIESLGGIDIQLLGIGRNGHIGFNEPSDSFVKPTHCVSLSADTIEANQRFFSSREEVPTEAYTMGIGSIMSARRILVIASGRDKAMAVRGMLEGPVTPSLPASILQLHNNVVLIADREAMGL